MVDRIEQEFIVDASRALQELNRLEAGFAKARRQIGGLSRALKTYNTRASQAVDITRSLSATLPAVGKGIANISANTQRFGRNIDKTRALETNLRNAFRQTKQLEKGLKGATKGTKDLTISFETFARIIGTQLIVRGIAAIQRGLTESVESAIQLQKQIALIQTITPDAGILQISQAVRDISDTFNLDIVETAAGLYNTLSNQVGSFGEALEFSAKAAQFAKATNSSLADSVDLLSGVIKAFGLTSKDTGDIAAKLFVGIDRGRVTADELANTLGRVLEPADALGISIEALIGGIAEITVKGTSAAESLTQFRGIINALTKPTPALAKAIRELGFATTEAAIQALELPGVLDAIVKSTDGTQEALAKLFPRIRSVGGILSLTGENLAGFIATTKEAKDATDAFAESKFFIATATDAEKVTSALNRLQNVFTEDVGNLIIRRGAALADFVGGLENIGPIVRTVIPAVESLTISLGVLIATVALVKFTAFIGLAGPIGLTAIAIIGLVAALKGLAVAADDRRIKAIREDIEAAGAASRKRLEELKKANQEEIKSEREKNQEILSETQKLAAATNLALRTQTQEVLTRDKALARSIKLNLQDVLSDRAKLLSAFTSVVQESGDIIRDSEQMTDRINRRQESRNVETRERGLPERVKVFNQIRRAQEQSTKAGRDFVEALRDGSAEGVKLAQSAFERAQSEIESARNSAQNLKNIGLTARADQAALEITNRQNRAEATLRETQGKRFQLVKENRSEIIGTNSEIKERIKRIGELARTTDEFGAALPPQVIQRNAAELEREVNELARLTVQGLGDATAAGLGDLVRDIEENLRQNPLKIKLDFLEVQKDIEAQQLSIQLAVDLIFPNAQQLRDATGRALTTPGEIGQTQSDIQDERQSLLQVEQTVNEELERRKGLTDEVNRAIARTTALVIRRGQQIKALDPLIPGVDQNETTKRQVNLLQTQQIAANTLRGALQNLADTGDTDLVVKALDTIIRITDQTGIGFGDLSQEIEGARRSIEAFGKLQQTPFTDVQRERLRVLQGVDAPFQRQGETLQESLTTSKLIVAEFQKVESSANRTRQSFTGLLQGLLGSLFGSTPTTNFAGIARLAHGGFTGRGTDTIPALLSRGESVINARASQRFFSQIQSFNAGGNPVSRVGDGAVNISTGDINVNGAQNPTATAREIDRSLNRLARRGQSRALRRRR